MMRPTLLTKVSILSISIFIVFSFLISFRERHPALNELVYRPPERFVYVPKVLSDFANLTIVDFEALSKYAGHRIAFATEPHNFYELGLRVRLFSQIFNTLPPETGKNGLYNHLEKQLYDFAFGKAFQSIGQIRDSFRRDRGVVITTGNAYFKLAVHAVRTLRFHGCGLPIEIFYNGAGDLNQTSVDFFRTLAQVTVLDINQFVDQNKTFLYGWDVKPFAVLFSSFKEVLLMDADTVWLQNPELLFYDSDYREHGALFFKDRSMFTDIDSSKVRWLASLFPEPLSSNLRSTRMFQGRTFYELESGAVVFNKVHHFIGLLTICKLNVPPSKSYIRAETHGEKETFWLGLELVAESYAFMPQLPGSIGNLNEEEEGKPVREICGHLAHFDRNGSLLWFNDGIVAGKNDPEWSSETGVFDWYGQEGRWTEAMCVRDGLLKEMAPRQKETLEGIKRLFVNDPVKELPKTATDNSKDEEDKQAGEGEDSDALQRAKLKAKQMIN